MKNWLPIHDFKADKFRSWLKANGVSLAKPTNDYELVRYRHAGKLGIVYSKPSKGRVTLVGAAIHHYFELCLKNIPIPAIEIEIREPEAGEFTLYTDASNYQKTGAGAWAGILIDPEGHETETSGALRGEISSSTEAEAMAVANALHVFLRERKIPRGATVKVICDNTSVVRFVEKATAQKSKYAGARRAIAHVLDLRHKFSLRLRGEWVRGHQKQNSTDPRAVYNRRCDALCSIHSKKLDRERKAERISANVEDLASEAREAAE